jgi:hypothetical protein
MTGDARKRVILYHATSKLAAAGIRASGFLPSTDLPAPPHPVTTGVWFADRPIDFATGRGAFVTIEIEICDAELATYEVPFDLCPPHRLRAADRRRPSGEVWTGNDRRRPAVEVWTGNGWVKDERGGPWFRAFFLPLDLVRAARMVEIKGG